MVEAAWPGEHGRAVPLGCCECPNGRGVQSAAWTDPPWTGTEAAASKLAAPQRGQQGSRPSRSSMWGGDGGLIDLADPLVRDRVKGP
ncbi:unnamed protein product [Brugia timori]|uniref:Uncharacterized protein n=1 Tax=Brugia timori TaxID=42155 RepID=A0A0R3QHU7_9BILA|nr:unnamed protein product [Brugia timori]